MTAKVNILTAAPDVMKAWTGAALAIAASLEPSLIELVKIRASQINGCANCINMHTTEARSQGAFTCCRPGAKRLATRSGSGPRWAGPRR